MCNYYCAEFFQRYIDITVIIIGVDVKRKCYSAFSLLSFKQSKTIKRYFCFFLHEILTLYICDDHYRMCETQKNTKRIRLKTRCIVK